MQSGEQVPMHLTILLINPWIDDFTAGSAGASSPGLFKVAEYLSAYEVALSFIDCTAAYEMNHFGAGRFRAGEAAVQDIASRTRRCCGISSEEFRGRVAAAAPVDLVFIAPLMSCWYPGIRRAAALVREQLGDLPVVLGGAYATRHPEHAVHHSGADFIYQGAVGAGINAALSTFGFRLKRRRGHRGGSGSDVRLDVKAENSP